MINFCKKVTNMMIPAAPLDPCCALAPPDCMIASFSCSMIYDTSFMSMRLIIITTCRD